MTEKWAQGEVLSIKHWTESLYSIRILAPEVKFTAGQYTKISLNINNEEVARPYSFVNSPNEEFLELSKPYTRKEGQDEQGTGLGLNICVAILKEHGFSVSSEKNKIGTRILINMR